MIKNNILVRVFFTLLYDILYYFTMKSESEIQLLFTISHAADITYILYVVIGAQTHTIVSFITKIWYDPRKLKEYSYHPVRALA